MLRWLFLLLVAVGAVSYMERDRLAPYAPPALAALMKGSDTGAAKGDGASGKRGGRGNGAPVAVDVAVATKGALPVLRETIGTILPVASTVMTSETTGTVAAIAVPDGAAVKRGDLLVSLDDRTAKAQIAKDQAAIDRDQVTLDQANRNLSRAQSLVKSGAYNTQQGEDAQSATYSAQAVLNVDRAALAADEVALAKLQITAPFDGRLGAFSVSTGALVTPGTAMVLLTQSSPVYAAFTLPQEDLSLLQESLSAGSLGVSLRPAGARGETMEGKVAFIDNAVVAASGSVALRAVIDNPQGKLVSGQSISATVKAGERDDLVLVPTVAVQPRQDGSVVYVVKDDDTVTIRKVDVAFRVGETAGLTQGLEPGERVVTEGQGALSEGSKVTLPGEAAKDGSGKDGSGKDGSGKNGGHRKDAGTPVAEAGTGTATTAGAGEAAR
ncbi:efflux RND transporter periplasmic adaptor subunit [Aureimonas sp. AU40]|uniref:efflux RND transporter periplasmic adaptor subunit n=1 Tax=Aureimonas sp. AU40 TaxID=1637747 RepID=UPI000784983B|nr:efflux RND transporter periplasmic adaptor subunit [Aureimonas sp. AU40]